MNSGKSVIELPHLDEELAAQCELQTFRSSGKGGQHVNKTESAVRLIHRPSGIVVTCRTERSQHRNRAICLSRLREKVAKMNYRAAPRIKTRVPKRAKEEVRREKARRSLKKKLRSRPAPDE